MKNLITVLGFVVLSSSFFGTAQANDYAPIKASKSERSFLCEAVDAMLAKNSADMALDTKKCLAATQLKSRLETEGTRTVSGTLTFRAPYSPGFTMHCFATYFGKPSLDSLSGDFDSAIGCE